MKKEILISIGITILFLGTSINQSIAMDIIKKSSIPLSDGNTLYVGGTGEGNYTRIQDAIDNASNGDTVFVFDDSSPYKEHILVDVSINLIGEERDTTIIVGSEDIETILINADCVRIKGFTISGGRCGIYIDSNNNTITGNNISNNYNGIGAFWYTLTRNNTITGNFISNMHCGLCIYGIINYTINSNTICSNNYSGIDIWHGWNISIQKNNFIKNKRHVKIWGGYDKNILDLNYWDNWIGVRIKLPIFQKFPKIIYGLNPFFNIDWHPAEEPYDIEV